MSTQAIDPHPPTKEAIDPQLPPEGSTVPAGRVFLVVLIALVLGAFLNADSLVEQAERKPFGWSRSFSLAVWSPVQDISQALALNRPRAWIDDFTGRSDSRPTDGFEFPPPLGGGDMAGPTPSTIASSGELPETTTTVTSPPPEPQLRVPTATAPLRVWVGGDSMAQVFGQSLVSLITGTEVMTSSLDYRISTGLTRPDYFNWPSHLAAELERLDPEAVVIMFGANDAQGLQTEEGEVFQVLSDGWVDHYRRRVAGTMDLLRGDNRIVYWVGQPIMRSSSFSERMAGLNAIYRQEAEIRPWVHFIDTYSLFANDAGGYEAFLPGPDGRVQDLRQGDGIHLSRAGGDLLARRILDQIEADIEG